MGFFVALLVLATFVAMLVGLVKPKTLRIKWLKTRPRVFGMGMLTMFLLTVIFANLIPETEENKQKRLARETEEQVKALKEAQQARAKAEAQAKIEAELAAAQKAKEQVRKVREAEEQAKTLKEAQQARAEAENQAKIEAELAAAQKAKEQARKIREAREVREKQERQAQLEREETEKKPDIIERNTVTPEETLDSKRERFPFTITQLIYRLETGRKIMNVTPHNIESANTKDHGDFQIYTIGPTDGSTWFIRTTVAKKTRTVYTLQYVRSIIKGKEKEAGPLFFIDMMVLIPSIEGSSSSESAVMEIFSSMNIKSVVQNGKRTSSAGKSAIYTTVFFKEFATITVSVNPV